MPGNQESHVQAKSETHAQKRPEKTERSFLAGLQALQAGSEAKAELQTACPSVKGVP